MTPEEQAKIDLEKPAFGENSQKMSDLSQPEHSEELQEREEAAPSEGESKVPYSRFKKFHDEAKRYQQEAEYWRQQAQTLKPEQEESNQNPLEEARKLWIENYGDTEATHKAWENQLKINQTLQREALEMARQEARETFQQEQYHEVQRIQDNVQTIDGELETLSDYVGRPLTEREEEAVLDIVDEFTPKDGQGNYAGALLPMDRAWEIYELKEGASKSGRRSSRDSIASLSGSQSEGNSDVQAEHDKHFNPSWGALDGVLRKRLGK